METDRICPNCRKPLPPDVPLGLCPECLIKSGFPTGTEPGVTGEAAAARFVPPSVGEIAQLFPQLEIIRLIGKGGMGAVYKARQPALDRFVALKVLPPAVASDPGFAERFNREARALARLSHPNIVAVHDFGKAGPLHYLIMEFVDGTNLREVERAGQLTSEQALAIVPQICEALQFAHNEGVVHRDIKPENLLLDKKGRLKITDFGIAKIVGIGLGQQILTGAKDVVGTPHYMAPEQIEKPQAVDHRADIYSLGVVFYEMLTGELPLGKFAPPSKKVQVDVRLDEVVLHTLEKEPERRYQQVSQVKTDVETIAGTPPVAGVAARPSVFSARDSQTPSEKTILPAFLLAFFFGVFGPHRFYVGKTGTAFLQLGAWCSCILMIIACATTGATFQPTLGILLGVTIFGCIVWATVDWILLLCRAFTDGQGKRITHWLHPQASETKAVPGSTGILPANSGHHEPTPGRQDSGAHGSAPPPSPPSGGAAPPAGGGPPPSPLVPGSTAPTSIGIIVAPAVGLMIAALWKLLSTFSGALFLFPFTNRFFNEMVGGHFLAGWGPIAITGMVIFKVIPALFILFGAFQMLQLRSYAWSIAAGILAIISCSLISLAIGIWALIVLGRQDVRDRFTEAARNRQSRTLLWPWILGAALFIPLLVLILFALSYAAGVSHVTIKGTVTDAVTGKAIAGARVDDNRYGADTDKPPAQAWTDANGRYELSTSYEEHTIAASAPGYETKLSLLRTKPFGSERSVRMNFRLQPESQTALPITGRVGKTNTPSSKEMAMQIPVATSTNAARAFAFQPIRIDAGSFRPFTDGDGHIWLPDQDFADGKTVKRSANLAIVNTQNPELYRTERYGMTSLSCPVPNGKYVVKLHFAETSDAITGPGERVFTFIVEGHEFKDFDVWATAGGSQRACVETANAEVTDGKLNIRFIPQRQYPEINGIEILPASPIAATEIPSPKTNETPSPLKLTEKSNQPKTRREKILGPLSTTDPFQQKFSRTLPFSTNGRLSLDNVDGRIEIAGWDRNEVSIKALKHGKTQECVEAAKVNIDSSPDEIIIHTEAPSSVTGFPWSWLWFKNSKRNDAKVDYAIQVPQTARLKQISSVNGRVEISDVSGDIGVSTVNAAVKIQNAAGSVELSTDNGWIEAELDSLDSGQTVSLSTVNGHIEAILPPDANAKVSASTVNGGISSDFPALTVKKEFPLGSKLKGTLGNGGATVTASSVNGRMNFQRGED